MFRVIPSLLYKDSGFYKGREFKNHVYLGDPENIIRIFNEKNSHELAILNITGKQLVPNDQIFECLKSNFLPLSYGGSINNFEYAKFLIKLGFDKLIFTSTLVKDEHLVKKCVDAFGSQAVIALLNQKKHHPLPFFNSKSGVFREWPSAYSDYGAVADKLIEIGVGEVIVQNPKLEGSMEGVSLSAANKIKELMPTPVLYSGGVGNNSDLLQIKNSGLDGALVGSKFVFMGKKRGILVSYDEVLDHE